jgi:hypothetical protein
MFAGDWLIHSKGTSRLTKWSERKAAIARGVRQGSFVTKSFHGIKSAGAPRGDVAGGTGDER